ncbi:MAG: hypothetical protein ACM30G_21635 [Micromonosporaceae bacterium]
MTTLVRDLRLFGDGLRRRVTEWVLMARRATAGPMLVRLVGTLAAGAAIAAAAPSGALQSAQAVAVVPMAFGVGLFPRTRWVSIVALGCVFSWLIATIGLDEEITSVRLGTLAVALYLMHAAAALAAVLPYDTIVAPAVLLRWALRTLLVLGASLCFGLAGLIALSGLESVPTLVAPIAGSLVAAALAGMLAWQLRHGRR